MFQLLLPTPPTSSRQSCQCTLVSLKRSPSILPPTRAMQATVGFLALAALFCLADAGRISVSRGKNVTKIDDLCARMHNNTALEGSSPLLMMQATAYECQKKCVDIFPECSAVVYYYLHNETKKHFCYLFDANSVSAKVDLVEQKPENKKDIVRMLELVVDCHQFDAHPPLEEDGLASSTDKVDRKKRQQSDEAVQGVGDWTDWSHCSSNGHEVRSQACEYGRKIQRRGCPARSAPQRMPAPPAPQFPPRAPQYPSAQQQQQQREQQQREQQLREHQARLQQQQQQQQQQRQPQQPVQPQRPPPQSFSGEQELQLQLQRQQQQQQQQRDQQQRDQQRLASGQSQIQLQSGPVPPQQQPQPVPQQPPQLERSPLDQQAQLYQQRMSQYRENYQQRHPARPKADPCPGGYCAPVPQQPERPTPPPVLAPVINTATQPPRPEAYPTRYRPAPPPPPACDGQGCVAPPVVSGVWHDWSDWSVCSCTCGDGAKSRRRECSTNNCQGADYETEPCNLGPCQTWSEWCEWSTCSASCGSGQRERTRFCHLGTNRCEGKDYESEQCNAGPCPEWSQWEDWGQCSVTCGQGVAVRQRTCLGGVFGDHLCQGPKTEQRVCDGGPCSLWSPWQEWSSCSATCGSGAKKRQRVCQYGTDCAGPNEESQFCYGPPCAEWTEWCEWSGCSSKCGPGQRTRTRGCLGSDGQEATTCQGSSIETTICEGQSCCNWSEWCHWSMCDKECGGGQSLRTRTCLNQQGSPDSACHCDGPDREEKQCNTQSCAPQCAWNQWCDWSPCSTQLACEVGVQTRSRQCVGESGCHCIGLAEESQQCRGLSPCPPKPPC